MVLCGFPVVLGRVLVMLCRFAVVLSRFLGHGETLQLVWDTGLPAPANVTGANSLLYSSVQGRLRTQCVSLARHRFATSEAQISSAPLRAKTWPFA